MEKRKRGRPRNLPKIEKCCSQPVKDTKTSRSLSASFESLPQTEKEQPKESLCSLQVHENSSSNCSDKSRDMSTLKEGNSETALKSEVLDDMDDSVLDFKAPVVKKRKIQAKLSFGSKQRSKDKSGKCSVPSAGVSADVEYVTTEPADVECNVGTDELKSSALEEVSEERNQGESTSADEAQQKGSLCPMCWKRFDKVNVVHLKACAAKHNMTTAQLMDAMALQDKQTAEREALGLPAVPCNQSSKKPSTRKGSGTSDSNDPNLQLALALSASMHEAEEQQMLQEDDVLLEAGLGQEVLAKQKTLLERFGFTSSRPALITASSPRPRGKHKLKGFPTLLLRTQEERDRLITEKVALILMGDENTTSEEHDIHFTEFTLNSNYLQQFLNEPKEFPPLSENEARLPSSAFYPENNVAGLSHQTMNIISPAYISKESGPLDCSLPVTPTLIKEGQELETSSDRHTCVSRRKSGTKVSSTSGFIDSLASDWRLLLNKSALSDITIYVNNRLKIPAHELVLYVRCPAILNDVVKDGKGVKYLLWTNVSFRPTLAFLEYIYCGSVNKILTLAEGFEDVQWLIEKYEVVNLLRHLEIVGNVRLKVNSKNISSEIQSDIGCKDITGETTNFQSILSSKYKSPKKHHLGLAQTSNSSTSKKCGNEVIGSLEFNEDSDLNFSSENVSKKSTSPDPFSESRINDVKCLTKDNSNIVPSATQDNMDYLLELIDSSSAVKSQSSDKSDRTVSNCNMKNELSKNIIPVKIGVLHSDSDSETVMLSSSQQSHGSDFSDERVKNELIANVHQVHKKVNSYCENLSSAQRKENIFYQDNSTENDVAEISQESLDSIPMQCVSNDSPNKRIEHPDEEAIGVRNSSSRRVLLESFTQENKSVPTLQQQNEFVVVCDLTQSSDDSDQKTISFPENQDCTPTREYSIRIGINSELKRNIEDLSKASIGKKHSGSGDNEVLISGNGGEELCKINISKEKSLSNVGMITRSLQKSPDENKRKCVENDPPCKTNSPVSKKRCTDHDNPVRKSLIESFVTESVGCARHKDEDLEVFDLTQVSDDYDHKAVSPPLGPSYILKSPSISHRFSPKRKVSNKFLAQNYEVSPVHNESLEKIKKIIVSDLSLNNGSGSNIRTESDCNDIAVINHSPPSYGLDNDDDDDDMDSCPKSRINERPNHGDSQGNASNGDMNHEIDYFDYYDSPCRPYISTLDSTHNSYSEKQDVNKDMVTERERLSLSQNNCSFNDNSLQHRSTIRKALSQDSVFPSIRNKSSEIIELDSSLEIDLKDTKFSTPVCSYQSQKVTANNGTPKLSKSKSSIRKSLDACKRLLDDSFGDKLGNLSLWKDEFNSVSHELAEAVACSTPKGMSQPGRSTPKTPVQMVKAVESHDVTPLADYSAMDSPMLKKQLHKYGIKPLKRKQAKIILRHIYNELHPLASVNENTQRTSPSHNHFKEPDEDTKVPKSPAKRNTAKQPSSPLKKSAVHSVSQQLENASEDSDCDGESSLSSSQSSSISSSRSDLIAADDVRDEPGLTQKEPSSPLKDLPEVVRNFILSDPELHQKVLLYEPIWLEQFYEDLKAMNYKFKMDQLMHYFDGQCITFRTSQQQRAAARKGAKKKKSPKKKPKTTKHSQRKKENGQKLKKSSSVTSSSQSTDSISR
ncbi:uro-adherence factor A isoform X2 [Anabrus simplex]|uniref:uro-adherence factor A isoform X2 n=1 Tax=Anabrus simplex TaxID=316456 RepID=UPI0035A2E7B3